MAAVTAFDRRLIPLCRYAAGASVPLSDDPELVASLRWLEARLQAWRCERLQRAARGLGPAPAALPLGTFARRIAQWLDDHPEQANEPLDWIVGSALAQLAAGDAGGPRMTAVQQRPNAVRRTSHSERTASPL